MVARLLLPLDMEAGREGEREAEGSIENSAVNQALRLLWCVMLLDGRLFNVHFNTCAFAWQTRDLQISLDLSCCFQTGGCLLYTRAEDHSNKVKRKKLFFINYIILLLLFIIVFSILTVLLHLEISQSISTADLFSSFFASLVVLAKVNLTVTIANT